MNYKTYNEFWGEFLAVTFHLDNPDRWPSRERKANWIVQNTDLPKGSTILDLGCGDGLIDIWLSRKGYQVTAVDRNKKVLELARLSDDTKSVIFQEADLKHINLTADTFNTVLLIETIGLMSKNEDQTLFKKIFRWLKKSGQLIIDCPEIVEIENSWNKDFSIGTVFGKSTFNPTTKTQKIDFTFKDKSGDQFGLLDSYDSQKIDGPGIARYIYPKSELIEILTSIGFAVKEIPHYYKKNYYSLICKKGNL